MILNKVTKRIAAEIVALYKDNQFQKIIKEDKKLDELQAEQDNPVIQMNQFKLLNQRKLKYKGREYNPLTVNLFGFLRSIRSNIVENYDSINTLDLIIFFYLLQTKDYSFEDLTNKAMKWIEKQEQFPLADTFNFLYKVQFRVLNLFPNIANGRPSKFNVDWMISLVSVVKPHVSYTTQELYNEVPLTQIYYYFAYFRKINGDDSILFRPEEEILKEIDFRTCQLVIDYLISKKKVSSKRRDKLIQALHANGKLVVDKTEDKKVKKNNSKKNYKKKTSEVITNGKDKDQC